MTNPLDLAQQLLADREFDALKAFLVNATGLSYYVAKDQDLAGRIARRFAVIGPMSAGEYLLLLGQSVGVGSELDSLIGELTIGETYFFRHTEQFDAVRRLIIPALLLKNQATRSLRIWCAGCSTGAEPYTLSIILRREFHLQTLGWTVEILGTDINRDFLARANEGRFDDWHLRTLDDSMKASCFERSGKSWLLLPDYKKGATFTHHNLISGSYPPRPMDPRPFDIIFCRNVMIYFSPETVSEIMPRFDRCMDEGSWLVLGYSEINTSIYDTFKPVAFPGALVFQKKSAPDSTSLPFQPSSWAHPPARLLLDPLPPPSPPPLAPAPTLPLTVDRYQEARTLAAANEFHKALKVIDGLLRNDQLDATAHFLRGLYLVATVDPSGAEQAFRKAIYIDRKFILAHYHLSLLYKSLGDTAKAARYSINARTLLSALPPAARLALGEDLTASQLTRLMNAKDKAVGE